MRPSSCAPAAPSTLSVLVGRVGSAGDQVPAHALMRACTATRALADDALGTPGTASDLGVQLEGGDGGNGAPGRRTPRRRRRKRAGRAGSTAPACARCAQTCRACTRAARCRPAPAPARARPGRSRPGAAPRPSQAAAAVCSATPSDAGAVAFVRDRESGRLDDAGSGPGRCHACLGAKGGPQHRRTAQAHDARTSDAGALPVLAACSCCMLRIHRPHRHVLGSGTRQSTGVGRGGARLEGGAHDVGERRADLAAGRRRAHGAHGLRSGCAARQHVRLRAARAPPRPPGCGRGPGPAAARGQGGRAGSMTEAYSAPAVHGALRSASPWQTWHLLCRVGQPEPVRALLAMRPCAASQRPPVAQVPGARPARGAARRRA
jgi:hypothetical protein